MSDDQKIIQYSDKKNTRKKSSAKEGIRFGHDLSFRANGGFQRIRETRNGELITDLSDSIFWINKITVHTNDLKDESILTIEGKRRDGLPLPPKDYPFNKFLAPAGPAFYYALYGLKVTVYPGVKPDIMASATHQYSLMKMNGDIPTTQSFGVLGWKWIDGKYQFLHAGGAINADGNDPSINVVVGGNSKYYRFLEPQKNLSKLKKIICKILNISKIHPYLGAMMLAAVARAPLGECHHTDFVIWISGTTGCKKSSIAALMMAFFGDFDVNKFPASWTDTANAIEMIGFIANCLLLVIDDFKKTGLRDGETLDAMVDRIVRNLSAGLGRNRLSDSSKVMITAYIRALIIVTAEDVATGQSLNGRCVHVPLEADSVILPDLTELQAAQRNGDLNLIGSSYISWLAPRMKTLKTEFPDQLRSKRDEIITKGLATSHPRAPEMFANLSVAFSVFLDFMVDTQLIEPAERAGMERYHFKSLVTLFKKQSDYVETQDQVVQFFELLSAGLSSGQCHIADAKTLGVPEHSEHQYGWRRDQLNVIEGDGIISGRHVRPNGPCVGWLSGDFIFLDPETAFAEAQKFARSKGSSIGMSTSTLWRRIMERGLLKAKEGDRPTVKRAIGSSKKRVLVFDKNIFDAND
jgi:hypothetical protein